MSQFLKELYLMIISYKFFLVCVGNQFKVRLNAMLAEDTGTGKWRLRQIGPQYIFKYDAKKGTLSKGRVSGHPGHPQDPPLHRHSKT